MTRDSLLKVLGEAKEGSRRLDAEIVVAINWRPKWCRGNKGELWVDDHEIVGGQPAVRLNELGRRSRGNPPIGDYPAYTTSLDAALSLVPEGALWQITKGVLLPKAGVSNGEPPRLIGLGCYGRDSKENPRYRWEEESAATPALALCIAALRSRAAEDGGT